MKMEQLSTPNLMTWEGLISMRRKALRRRVWFGALSKMDRSVVELTISCVDRVRSTRLALALGRIVCKVLNAFKSRFMERVETIGHELVEKISRITVGWGYVQASAWKQDTSFIKYLGVKAANTGGWG